MNSKFEEKIRSYIDNGTIVKNEMMKKHSTFRVGGPADYFASPKNIEELCDIVKKCKSENISYYIIGNGSNLLVGDKGYRGVVIQLFKEFDGLQVNGNKITAQAGCRLSQIANEALRAELTGFEFAAGIPGTLGGAVIMNAGAYGGEMKDVLDTVTVLTQDGEVKTLSKEELGLGYRTSKVADDQDVVLEASILLQSGKKEEIKAVMDDLREKRVSKQPLEYPSAGSTFKRPEGYFAGKLIQDAGLRGFSVGGAQVSEKHCGFVINKGDATAADVKELIEKVIEKVREDSGVTLEPEVKQLGEF